jgi:hypothetical protein
MCLATKRFMVLEKVAFLFLYASVTQKQQWIPRLAKRGIEVTPNAFIDQTTGALVRRHDWGGGDAWDAN